MYSDNFSTEKFVVDGATGGVSSYGLWYMPNLPTNSAAGSGYLWYNTADNTVKYTP
jgi:hypothetical protein